VYALSKISVEMISFVLKSESIDNKYKHSAIFKKIKNASLKKLAFIICLRGFTLLLFFE